jgi:hypothetical protein
MCSCRLPSSPLGRPMRPSPLLLHSRSRPDSLCSVFDLCGTPSMHCMEGVSTTVGFHPKRQVALWLQWRHAIFPMREGTAAFSTTIAR